jgi:hypothetical protein
MSTKIIIAIAVILIADIILVAPVLYREHKRKRREKDGTRIINRAFEVVD